MDTEKYKALYEYQKEQCEESRQRFHRLEDKAVKYLTSLTIAASVYALLIRSVFESLSNPSCVIEYITIISIALTFYAMCSTWSFIFRAIKLQKLVKMPSNDKVIDLFKKNKKAEIYLGLSKKYTKAIKLINSEYDEKLKFVRKGYSAMVLSGWCFLISVSLIFINLWR